MTKTAHRLLIAIIIGSVCIAYFAFFGYQTLMIFETRYLAWKAPVVKKIPIVLANAEVSNNTGANLSFLGYEFEVPWDDVDASRTKQVNNMVSVFFRSGNALVISGVPPRDLIRSVMSSSELDEGALRRIYGEQAFQSDYELKRAIFENTPSSITLLTPNRLISSKAMILMTKGTIVPEKDSEIYSIRSANFKGFQLGNPANHPTTIALELYADDGELEVILMQKKQGPPPSITQAEINRIIQTAHRIDAEPK